MICMVMPYGCICYPEKLNAKSHFGTQKAQLYAHLGKVDLMIVEYLNELERNPKQKSMVFATGAIIFK